MLATSAADIRRARKQKKIAALMGIEGGHAIENSLATLREFHRLGVRYMTLTWNNTNDWADAGRGDKKHGGLSPFGEEVVREMNRLGMLVDVSHVSDDTMSDALDVSKAPIIASHSSARALSNVPRNIPDDLLRRIAKNGGVVQVNFYSVFVDAATVTPQNDERNRRLKAQQDALDEKFKNDPERLAEEGDKLDASSPLPPLPISKLIDHIDHIVKPAVEAAAKDPRLFALEDLRPGMKGTSRTVFAGTEPQEFGVEILGVLPGYPAPRQTAIIANGTEIKRRLTRDSQFVMEGLAPGKYRVTARAFTKDLIPSAPLSFEFTIAKAPFPLTSTALAILLALALLALLWAILERRRIARTSAALVAANNELADARSAGTI